MQWKCLRGFLAMCYTNVRESNEQCGGVQMEKLTACGHILTDVQNDRANARERGKTNFFRVALPSRLRRKFNVKDRSE